MSVMEIRPGQREAPSCHVCGAIMTRAPRTTIELPPWVCASCGASTEPSVARFINDQISRDPVSQPDGYAGEPPKPCVAIVYSCRVCGAQKKETNHWYIVSIASHFSTKKLLVSEWNVPMADLIAHGDPNFVPACGESCAHKLLSRWFTARSFDEPNAGVDPRNAHNQEKK